METMTLTDSDQSQLTDKFNLRENVTTVVTSDVEVEGFCFVISCYKVLDIC